MYIEYIMLGIYIFSNKIQLITEIRMEIFVREKDTWVSQKTD